MANRIEVNSYYIKIIADNQDAGLLSLISTIPVFKGRKRNEYFVSLRNIPEVFKILRNIDTPVSLSPLIKRLYEEETVRRERTDLLKKLGPDMQSDWLWPHQCLGIELAQINRRYAFFYDTRTGKTLMALKIMYDALKAGRAKRCVVICPSAIIQSWLNDARDYFPELKIAAYYGTVDQRLAALKKPAHIVLWSMEQAADCLEVLKAIHFDIAFVDESSKLKSHKSKITQAMLDLSLTIPSWYLLSATPAPNNESEYYSQIRTIDPYAFAPARTHFVNKYFDNKSRSPQYEKLFIKPYMRAEFMSIVNSYAIYVDQSVMPTAGKEWVPYNYDLDKESKERYETMRTSLAVELQGITITADMAAAVRSKLNQITSGFIMDTAAIKENKLDRKLGEIADRTEVYSFSDNRIKTLLHLLSTPELKDEKVVIWANYHQEFLDLEKALGNRARYIRGGCDTATKEQYIYKEFKEGSLQYLVCHPLSVGMGINLTEAHIAIYYSLNDSWEALKQSSERIAGHIKVQPKKCLYYVLLANGTVNELIYSNLKNKRDSSYGLLEHLQAEALL